MVIHVGLVRAALTGLPKVVYHSGWDNSRNAGNGSFDPRYVIMHHTAGTNSLSTLLPGGTYDDACGSHFLIDADGTIHVLTAGRAYHAGAGGPWNEVPEDSMNGYGWGIEIESLGTSQNMPAVQIEAAAAVAAGLLREMNRSTSYVLNHKDWAPSRKVDTVYSRSFWQDKINEEDDMPTADEIGVAVAKHVWRDDVVSADDKTPDGSNPTWMAGSYLKIMLRELRTTNELLRQLVEGMR